MKIGGGLTFLRYLEGVQLALTGVGNFENEHPLGGYVPLYLYTKFCRICLFSSFHDYQQRI